MYPRNAATPPEVLVGQVVQISDGAVQTTGASARVKIGSGAWAAASGTLTCDTTSGFWYYAPTQAETDATYFMVAVYKASCLGCGVPVITTASATAGYGGIDWGKVANETTSNALSGTTISTSQAVASVSGSVGSVTGAVGSVTGNVGGNVVGSVASVTGAVGSVTGNVGGNVTGSVGSISGVTFPTNFGDLAITVTTGRVTVGTNADKTGYSISGTITTLDALSTHGDSTWATATGFSTLTTADVNAEVDTALADYDAPTYTELLNFVRLMVRDDSAANTDLAAVKSAINADTGTGTGSFNPLTDSLGNIYSVVGGFTSSIPISLANDSTYQDSIANTVSGVMSGSSFKLDHLLATSVTGTDIADNSIIAKLVSKSATADWDSYDNTTDSMEATSDRLPSALTAGGNIKADTLAINGSTTAAVRLALSAAQIVPGTVDTVTNTHTPTSTEFQADDITEATSDHYVGRVVIFTSGALAGQGTVIEAYSQVGGIGQFTVREMTEAPANNDTFIIV